MRAVSFRHSLGGKLSPPRLDRMWFYLHLQDSTKILVVEPLRKEGSDFYVNKALIFIYKCTCGEFFCDHTREG